MISIAEAFAILEKNVTVLHAAEVPLWEARNAVLARTIISPIDMPPFRQSNMDGFALSLHDRPDYEIVGEIKAGDGDMVCLECGQAVKIFTGAAVPDSAQAVIQIEKVSIKDGRLHLQDKVLAETNVRPQASQIARGSVALEKGTILNPAAIGFLAGLGLTFVKIYQKPKIAIVVTGNELVMPGTPLTYGKVYESNAVMLKAALQNAHYDQVTVYQVADDFELTKNILRQAIAENDLIIISGGISVGDYDFVGTALQSLGVETLFYKVNQKPGKPLFVGKSGDKMIFALPGNPAACLTCLYVYVLPTLQKMSGKQLQYGQTIERILSHDYKIANARCQFLKAIVNEDEATILPHQDSSMLDSYAVANALVYVSDGDYHLDKGDKVAVYLIG